MKIAALLPAALLSVLTVPVALSSAPAFAAGAHTSLEQRVQRLEDESDIRRIINLYGASLDARDYKGYAGLFADDGEWIGGFGAFKGPPAIEKMLVDHMGTHDAGYVNRNDYHLMSNPIIRVDGDTAHATSKFLFMVKGPDGKPAPAISGVYVDDFVRVNGAWKIKKRVAYPSFPKEDQQGAPEPK